MYETVLGMFDTAKEAFQSGDLSCLKKLADFEEKADNLKKSLMASHFMRLSTNSCSVTHSPYYTSLVTGLERVADHLVNVGYSIENPTGDQNTSV